MDTAFSRISESASTSSSQNSSVQTHTELSVTAKKKARLELEHASKLSARERADLPTNKNDFYADGNTLFCRSCVVPVDYSRQFCLEQHKKTKKHLENASNPTRTIQKTLTTTFAVQNTAKLKKVSLVTDYIRMLIATNTPFNTANHPETKAFFKKHVNSGGSVPNSRALYPYIDDVYKVEKEKLVKLIPKKKIFIIFDETSDDFGRKLCNVLFGLAGINNQGTLTCYLTKTFIEQKSLDYQRAGQLVMKSILEYRVDFEDVIGFCSDNVSYMYKCYEEMVKPYFPNCIHLSCNAHIMNLVSKAFLEKFTNAKWWSKNFPEYFSHSGNRKARYVDFLEEKGFTKKLCPTPCVTRWGSFFACIKYHADYYQVEADFVKNEKVLLTDRAPDLLDELCAVVNGDKWAETVLEIMFVTSQRKYYQDAIDIFQSNIGLGMFVYPEIDQLRMAIENQKNFNDFTILDNIPDMLVNSVAPITLSNFVKKVSDAATAAGIKLEKYFDEATGIHPGLSFMRDVVFFNPAKCFLFTEPKQLKIPGIANIPQAEFILFTKKARGFKFPVKAQDGQDRPKKMDVIIEQLVHIKDFWTIHSDVMPNLSKLALCYGFLYFTSAEVERSFSKFNSLLSADRKKLELDSICKILFLFYNLNVEYFE